MTTALADVSEKRGPTTLERQVEGAADVPAAFRTVGAVTTVGLLQIAVLIVMLVRSKVLALLLKPEGVGIVSTVDQLVQFVAQVSALSLIPTPTRFIVRAVDDGAVAVSTMYSALVKLLAVSTAAGTLIAVGFLLLEPDAFGTTLANYQSFAVIAVLSAPIFALSGFFTNMSAAIKGYSATSIYLLISAAASLAAAFIGIQTAGIAGLYYANLVSGAIVVFLLARYLHASAGLRFGLRGSRLRDLTRRHPDILAYCGTTYVLSFAQPLAFLLVRAVMLKWLGPAEAGFFQAAFTISSIASLILMQAIRIYLEPAVNTASANDVRIAAANEFQRPFALLVLLGTLPLVLFPRDAIGALFSHAFLPVSSVVFVFVLADCVFLCNQVYSTVLMASDDFRGFFQTQFAGLVALCVGVWLLAPRFGLAGVAWSFFGSRALVFVLTQWLLAVRHRLTLTRRTAAVIAYVLCCLGAGAVLVEAADGGILLRMGLFAAAAGATVLFLTRQERAWLATVARRIRKGPLTRATQRLA